MLISESFVKESRNSSLCFMHGEAKVQTNHSDMFCSRDGPGDWSGPPDHQPSNTCTHSPSALTGENKTFLSHKSMNLRQIYEFTKAQILFPHQSQHHEHPGVWDAVHYAFWSLVFLSHYFLSQSHCKETKLCYLATFQRRDNVPWKQAIVSSSCHWNWKLKLSSCRQSASWCVNTPTLPMDRKLRETAPSKALKAHAGISLFGCWESANHWTRNILAARSQTRGGQPAAPCPERTTIPWACLQKDLFTGLLCWSFWNRPITTFHPGWQFLNFKGIIFFVLFKQRRKIKATT